MKVGLITYHSAYNFGSVLQAYATQKAVERIVGNCAIINYRMNEQKIMYSNLRTKYGIKPFIKDLVLLPEWNARKERAKKFESFIRESLNLTQEFSEPEKAGEYWKSFDVMVSGSDQIWNKNSLEFYNNDWKYMNPYLLYGFKGKKISYASSTANMSKDDLYRIKDKLIDFDSIAMREHSSVKIISELTGKSVAAVLDPTFLLTADEWRNSFGIEDNKRENYILYYSLYSISDVNSAIKSVKTFARKRGCEVIAITPFVPPVRGVKTIYDTGPIEFLKLLNRAKYIITDSYHGTILSVNFHKDMYSICKKGGSEFRKTDILNDLGIGNRIIYDIRELENKKWDEIEYSAVDAKLERLRVESQGYLQKALLCET